MCLIVNKYIGAVQRCNFSVALILTTTKDCNQTIGNMDTKANSVFVLFLETVIGEKGVRYALFLNKLWGQQSPVRSFFRVYEMF